jgi:putative exosortase-associated protein (TIGR04073 family)
MKANLLVLCVAALLLGVVTSQAATDNSTEKYGAGRKLGRGFSNLLFGIVEVPNQISKVGAEHGGGAASTYGVGKGIWNWFGREGVGLYEIITFPLPIRRYRPIILPEFPNEDYEP